MTRLSIYYILFFGLCHIASAQTYTYDAFNRLTAVAYPDGSSIAYTYDKLGNRLSGVQSGAGVAFRLKAILNGAYNTGTGNMNDQLRVLGMIPLSEPYTALGLAPLHNAGCTIRDSAALFSDRGDNSIVDWVLLELRDAADGTDIRYSQPFFVQRDGDVVGMDGASPPTFREAPAGNYYVAIRHRNHLGVMTATPVSLSSNLAVIDFTSASTPVYGVNPMKIHANGKRALWGGDANANKIVKYNGSANDRNAILAVVGLATPNRIVSIYSPTDLNLDGVVKNNGTNNDRNVILQNLGLATPNLILYEQLPQ